MRRGRFITLEGGEGTGKSTQVSALAARLADTAKVSVVTTREPGGSPRAEWLRKVLLSGRIKRLGPFVEAMVFALARADHVRVTIRPALARGAWVICDRFTDSTRAYQGWLGQVPMGFLATLEKFSVGATRPDLTLVLDLDAREGLARATARRGAATADRFESEGLVFHERLREAYRELAAADPERCVLIDASGDALEVADRIFDAVRVRLGLTGDTGGGGADGRG